MSCDQQVDATPTTVRPQRAEAGVGEVLDARQCAEIGAADSKVDAVKYLARSFEQGLDPLLTILAAVAVEEDVDVLLNVDWSQYLRVGSVVHHFDSPCAEAPQIVRATL